MILNLSKIFFRMILSKKWVDTFPPISSIIKVNRCPKDIDLKNIFQNFLLKTK